MKIIVLAGIFGLTLVGCKSLRKENRSIDRVETLSQSLFRGEIVGPTARSGEHRNAAVVFNARRIPPALGALLDKSRDSNGSEVFQGTLSAKWDSKTEIWTLKSNSDENSYTLKIVKNGDLFSIVMVEK